MADLETLRSTFAAAAEETLRVMAGVESIPTDVPLDPAGDVYASIRLIGGADGRLVLQFPAATAEALARRVLEDAPISPAMIRDCMGEIANVVAGQAKTMSFGTPEHFSLSTPNVSDHPNPAHGSSEPAVTQCFTSDAGPFSLSVELNGASTDKNEAPNE